MIEGLIFKCLSGSHMYGTNTESSDEDFKGIFVQSPESVLENGYKEQISISDDEVYYEIRRFVDLAAGGNANMLEILFCPEDNIKFKHPVWDLVRERRFEFLSKQCRHSFIGYAYEQIKKANGLDKKMNWEKDKTERKDILDFCYIIPNNEKVSIPVKKWLDKQGYKQEACGLTEIPHFRFCYFLYYDHHKHMMSDNPRFKGTDLKYKGIAQDLLTSNSVSLSEIPFYAFPEGVLSFNSDGYSMHCKDYNSYQTWLKERNESRYVDSKLHGQKIDGKNLLHCVRLLETGVDIAEKKDLIVRRENAPYLISIRKGEVNLQEILDKSEEMIEKTRVAFDKSDLQEKVDRGELIKLVTKVRRAYYEYKGKNKEVAY